MNEYRKSHVIEKNNIAGVRDVLKEIVARRTVLMNCKPVHYDHSSVLRSDETIENGVSLMREEHLLMD